MCTAICVPPSYGHSVDRRHTGFSPTRQSVGTIVHFPRTPGHPESHLTPGIEVTTGPLGQGFANAVGLTIANTHLSAVHSEPGSDLFPGRTFAILGDGCMMEGITSETASLCGHLKLSKLIAIYDDNRVSIDGPTSLAFSEDVGKRFEAYGFSVLRVSRGDEDLEAMLDTLDQATQGSAPTLIILSTTIGKHSAAAGTEKAHGSPLGPEDVASVKRKIGFDPEKSFFVPEEVRAFYANLRLAGEALKARWEHELTEYVARCPDSGRDLLRRLSGTLPDNWRGFLPDFTGKEAMATRKASEVVLSSLAPVLTELIGGSADLTPSTLTLWKGAREFHASKHGDYTGRYVRYGVREHAMFAVSNGIAAFNHAFRPFASTFLNFITYAFGAVRLSAISRFPVLYIMTHDSIGLGEDGPTHQPIEVLALLRATPNLSLWRPADGNEVSAAYEAALACRDCPTVLALSRQSLPQVTNDRQAALKGAYILKDASEPELIVIATGSEVSIALDALKHLEQLKVRVISMPSTDQLERQPVEYRRHLFLDAKARPVPVLSIEAASPVGWDRYAHEHVAMHSFGASGPYKAVYEKFGFTAAKVAEQARKLVYKYRDEAIPLLPVCRLE